MKKLILFLFLSCLVGCNEYYHKYNGSTGYSDLTYNNHFEISFAGDEYLTQTDVKFLAMVRASEIGSQSNYKYFVITRESFGDEIIIIKDKSLYQRQEFRDSAGYRIISEEIPRETRTVKERPTIRLVGVFTNENSEGAVECQIILEKAHQRGIEFKRL